MNDRAAAHVLLDDTVAMTLLLPELREVGAGEQVGFLVDRLPVAGLSGMFLKYKVNQYISALAVSPMACLPLRRDGTTCTDPV